MPNTTKPEVKNNLVDSKELVNWVAYKRFCEKLKEELRNAEKTDEAIIVEIWKFPRNKPPEATAEKRLEQT